MERSLEQIGTQWLVKGKRTDRSDSFAVQLISRIYTSLVNIILGTAVSDVNGLPKCFPTEMTSYFQETMEKSFTFDAEILLIATLNNFQIIEIPVKLRERLTGVSSWSGQRILIYRESLKRLFSLRNKYASLSFGQD
jgi:hypothetical protein